MDYVSRERPEWTLTWMPSVLFLTGFPQINWGYHIFTDTLGYATALATAVYADWLVKRTAATRTGRFWTIHLALIFTVSSVAFLARETGWLAVIGTVWLCCGRRRAKPPELWKLGLILLALTLGKIPHSIYAHAFNVRGVPLESSFSALTNWRYILDFTAKSAVCFNLSWLFAAWGCWKWFRSLVPFPPLIVGWTIGALLYMGAGYYVNKIHLIGYPLRMSYALFPVVFFFVANFFESLPPKTDRAVLARRYCLAQFAINLFGVWLDPGRSGIKATEVLRSIRDFFRR
jgi:hypothetical protein